VGSPEQFGSAWSGFVSVPGNRRFLFALAMGTMAFAMQDIILEPYGGEVLGLSVSATSFLTVLLAGGALLAFLMSAKWLRNGWPANWVAALGAVVGLFAFAMVILAEPMASSGLFRLGTFLIGLGGGLFSIGTLAAAMTLDNQGHVGMAIGAWGAVHATSTGIAIAMGGAIRDLVSGLAASGELGTVLSSVGVGYAAVYQIELLLLFVTLIALGPLVFRMRAAAPSDKKFGLADFPS
jgi:BCD family chlorophyll transporter-like MFS transporter